MSEVKRYWMNFGASLHGPRPGDYEVVLYTDYEAQASRIQALEADVYRLTFDFQTWRNTALELGAKSDARGADLDTALAQNAALSLEVARLREALIQAREDLANLRSTIYKETDGAGLTDSQIYLVMRWMGQALEGHDRANKALAAPSPSLERGLALMEVVRCAFDLGPHCYGAHKCAETNENIIVKQHIKEGHTCRYCDMTRALSKLDPQSTKEHG